MDKNRFESLRQKINSSADTRLIGMWMLRGPIVELSTTPAKAERDEEMLNQLLTQDPAAAPVLRGTVDYMPNAKKVQFHYWDENPCEKKKNLLQMKEVDGSDFDVWFSLEVLGEMNVLFCKH